MNPEGKAPIPGSCLCGRLRYEIVGTPLGINYCHCRQCRKASGTAFATNMAVAESDFSIQRGAQHLNAFESSCGKKRFFCANCGSPIYSRSTTARGTVYVRIGTVDDDSTLHPEVHIHVASKAPWYEINDGLPQLQEEEGLGF